MRMTQVVIASLLVATACAARVEERSASASAAESVLPQEFRERLDRYMAQRNEAGETALFEQTTDPSHIRAAQQALAAHIRLVRVHAKQGDILTPFIQRYFRAVLAPELKGEQGRDIRATLDDDAPAPGAVSLDVNAIYPAGVPFPTTPAVVLQTLPPLPRGLEYRIIGRDLVLVDQPANVVVDFMRNAIPERAVAAPARP